MSNIIDETKLKKHIENRSGQSFAGLSSGSEVVYFEYQAPNGKIYSSRPEAFETEKTIENAKAKFISQLENTNFD